MTSSSENIRVNSTGTPIIFKITGPKNLAYEDFGDSDGYMTNSDGSKKIPIGSNYGRYADFSTGEDIFYMGLYARLDGTEADGEYSTQNPGGQPLLINIDY